MKNANKIGKSIIFIFISFILLINLTGCSKEDEGEQLLAKVDKEMDYMDSHLVAMLNELNEISYDHYKLETQIINKEELNSRKTEGSNESTGQGGSEQSDSESSSSESNSDSNQDSKSEENKDKITTLLPNSILNNQNTMTIDWSGLKQEVEELYQTWGTIALDLHALNIKSEDVLAFTSQLDLVTQAVKSENKAESLTQLVNLYNLIPKYIAGYTKDATKMNSINTKANILEAYALLENGKWDEMKLSIQKAEENFSTILNSLSLGENKQVHVNKAYMLLKELQNSIEKKDREIFLINYKNIMQELENFQ